MFSIKYNAQGEIVKYKVRLVARGDLQDRNPILVPFHLWNQSFYLSGWRYDKGEEKLSDNVISNMSELWTNVNKNYYKIKKYLLELFSLHRCEYISNEEPSPVSIDASIKEYDEANDEDEKEDIINSFEKDLYGVV